MSEGEVQCIIGNGHIGHMGSPRTEWQADTTESITSRNFFGGRHLKFNQLN